MFKNLSPGAIGIKANLEESLELAQQAGFAGIDLPLGECEALGAAETRRLFEARGLRAGGFGVPVNWRGEQAEFEAGMAKFPAQVALAREIGATRCSTWVPSWSDERMLADNYQFHIDRFGPIARALAAEGCQLGLEFLGPKTLRDGHKYEFVHTLPDMLKLCAAIGPNCGLLLDCWHWYTAHGTLEQLDSLRLQDVVYVHVNDAPPGIAIDEQKDNIRALPGETGVIDISAFMGSLQRLGYDGPVTAEPFSQRLRDVAAQDPLAAARETAESLNRIWPG